MIVWVIVLAVLLGVSVFINIQLYSVGHELKAELIHIAEEIGTRYEYGKFGNDYVIDSTERASDAD